MTPEEFKRRLDELQALISEGIADFSAWRGLMVEDEDSAQALNRYRGLFLPARNSLQRMMLLQFANIFDPNPRTVSLRNLLALAMKDREQLTPFASADDLKSIQTQIDENESLLQRLKRVRDQRIAHHDAITSGDRSVLSGEMLQLVEAIQRMYNALRGGHEQASTSFGLIARDAARHTSEVVSIMREERNKALRRIEETKHGIGLSE